MANLSSSSLIDLSVQGYWDNVIYASQTMSFPLRRMSPCSLYFAYSLSYNNGGVTLSYSMDGGSNWTQFSGGSGSYNISLCPSNGYIYTDKIVIKADGYANPGIHSTGQVIQEPGYANVTVSECYLYGDLQYIPYYEYSAVGTSSRQIWEGDEWFNFVTGVQTPPHDGVPRQFPRDASGRFAYFMRSNL